MSARRHWRCIPRVLVGIIRGRSVVCRIGCLHLAGSRGMGRGRSDLFRWNLAHRAEAVALVPILTRAVFAQPLGVLIRVECNHAISRELQVVEARLSRSEGARADAVVEAHSRLAAGGALAGADATAGRAESRDRVEVDGVGAKVLRGGKLGVDNQGHPTRTTRRGHTPVRHARVPPSIRGGRRRWWKKGMGMGTPGGGRGGSRGGVGAIEVLAWCVGLHAVSKRNTPTRGEWEAAKGEHPYRPNEGDGVRT